MCENTRRNAVADCCTNDYGNLRVDAVTKLSDGDKSNDAKKGIKNVEDPVDLSILGKDFSKKS